MLLLNIIIWKMMLNNNESINNLDTSIMHYDCVSARK